MAKSSSFVTGYWYRLSVLLGICHGPVDSINTIAVGGRVAWSGSVTTSGAIEIDRLKLFGGKKREGGVAGIVQIMMGERTQVPVGLLAQKRGASSPAYRGLACLMFEDFTWAANNPYFKAPTVEATRILKGWRGDEVWYPEKAAINVLDMNPVHIIYECLTSTDWGMGYDAIDLDASLDGSSFKTAADQLYAEGFGMSLPWAQQSSVEEFLRIIIDHIGAGIQFDVVTGKFTLQLIRGGYDLDDPAQAMVISPDNAQMENFQRAAWGETANEVVVVYSDRSGNKVSLSVQDPANIDIQGATVSITKQYPGLKTAELAERAALRDLVASSSPLAKSTLLVDRSGANLKAGNVIKLVWPSRKITGAAYRVVAVNRGTLVDGKIRIEVIEDVFGLPDSGYLATGSVGGWTPTYADPEPLEVDYQRADELTYYDLATTLPAADLNSLLPGDGFGRIAACYQDFTAYSFELVEDVAGTWEEKTQGHFCSTVVLVGDVVLSGTPSTHAYTGERSPVDLTECAGQYGLIDEEIVLVTSIGSGYVTFSRGCLDTVPAAHTAGSVLWLYPMGYAGFDTDTHVDGETIDYKVLAETRSGILDPTVVSGPEYCAPVMLEYLSRKDRPYPPGRFKLGGNYYPSGVGGDIVVTWAGRNRLTQTAGVIDTDVGSISVEAGTTYTIKVYDPTGATPLVPVRTVTGISGATETWTYTAAMETTDGGPFASVRITLTAVRDGYNSWQTHDWTFTHTTGLGETLGENLGDGT